MKTRLCCGAGDEHRNHSSAHEPFLSNIEVELMVTIQILLYINECMLFLIGGPRCKVAVCPDWPLIGRTVQLCVCLYIVVCGCDWETVCEPQKNLNITFITFCSELLDVCDQLLGRLSLGVGRRDWPVVKGRSRDRADSVYHSSERDNRPVGSPSVAELIIIRAAGL